MYVSIREYFESLDALPPPATKPGDRHIAARASTAGQGLSGFRLLRRERRVAAR